MFASFRFAPVIVVAAGVWQCAIADTAAPLVGFPALDAFYRESSELAETRSSGWKPASRIHWFLETRQAPHGISAAAIRRSVFQERRARSRSSRSVGTGWFSAGPFEWSGRVNALAFAPGDPQTVYVGTAGGLWKSTDGGDTWAPQTDELPVNEIGGVCLLPWDSQVVVIGTGLGSGATFLDRQGGSGAGPFGIGILKSTDGGASWNSTSLVQSLGGTTGFNGIEANPITHTLLAAANDGVFRSTDDGDTWTQVESGGNFWDVKWKPGDANRVYVAKGRDPFLNFQTTNGVRVSTDDGLTFAPVGTGQPPGTNLSQIKIGVTPADPSVVYAHYGEIATHTTLGIYRSTDDGNTWEVRNDSINMSINQSWYNAVLAVDPMNADRLVTGGVHLYRSTDGGTTYAQITSFPEGALGTETLPHVDFHASAYEPGSATDLWVATDGGPWRSTDGGATWSERRTGLVTYTLYDVCVSQSDSTFLMTGGQDSGFFGSSSGVWDPAALIGDGMMCHIHADFPERIYAEAQNGALFRSVTGGSSWAPITNAVTGTPIWVNAFEMEPQRFRSIYTARSTGIWNSTNRGDDWVNVSPHVARWISASPVDGSIVWTMSNSAGVWVTTDEGTTWTQSASWPAPGGETTIEADAANPAAAIVTVGGYGTGLPHLLRTTNFGGTWQDVTGDFPDQPANAVLVDPLLPEHWYVGSDTGVWRSTDGGSTWLPYGTGLANGVITDLELQQAARKLVAGTFGRGVWETTLETPTDAPVPTTPSAELMLDRPFPNPASNVVTLRWGSRRTQAATLTIYDVRGRRVSRLDSTPSGQSVVRSIPWVLDDVPSGIYFAVVEVGEMRLSRRVVVAH